MDECTSQLIRLDCYYYIYKHEERTVLVVIKKSSDLYHFGNQV